MEGDVDAQVAPPIFLHQPLPIRSHDGPIHAKKRDFPWQNPNDFYQQEQLINQWIPNPNSNWNPRFWDWDSVTFTAKPSSDAPNLPNLGPNNLDPNSTAEENVKVQTLSKGLEEDGGTLTLKLGGGAYSVAEEQAARPSKRVRCGSPGNGGNYPMCQVDDCRADLSNAKDYHRRHKVCDIHSKTTKALVGKQMQRFCQQCSRFHPLSEFDEGKRSCRRRLAGHNRRRRKTQPEDVSSKLLTPGSKENITNANAEDIVHLLTILAKLQGNNAGKPVSVPSLPDRDRLIQIFSKINSLTKIASPKSTGFDLNVSQPTQQESFDQSCKANGNPAAPSTMDLFTVLSAALAASAPEVLASLSQMNSYSSVDDKTKMTSPETTTDANSHSKSAQIFAPSRSGLPLLDSSNCPCQEARQVLPLQLFGSAEDDSPPKFASSGKYFSSESSNPMEDGSPLSSPPMAQMLFPLHSATGRKHGRMSVCWEDGAVEASTSCGWTTPLELFKESERRVENGVVHSLPYQGGYTSSSISDHSPSSSNSDAQDRTGRIIFKLFDKDPSKIPPALRSQIVIWLAHSPSEMESYIRPGCVVLSVYASMPSIAWDDLEEDLLQRVTSLVQNSDSEFWRNGRFLVRTSRQLASHMDGKIHHCKSWRTWSAPEVTSVLPVAVVGGQETSLVLKGRNLTIPGTKIHCTYMGGYTSKEVLGSAHPRTIYDDSSLESFTLPGGLPNAFGRCFIEVENGFKGNSFPVIIANSTICQELRALESEFEEDVGNRDAISGDQTPDNGQLRSREDLLHFLNELGWLFQRKSSHAPCFMDFSTTRFKFLFTFSVERDWSALSKTLLDILTERSLKSDALAHESLEMLLEVQLLSRAVKRKCRKMVDLLLGYYVVRGEPASNTSRVYLFPPNSISPGGVTPLHIAASTQDSEDMVDALTNDPQEIGLNCWNSILDESGQSPYMYASQRNYHSYNRLVSRKLADRKNDQVSINVGNEISMKKSWIVGVGEKESRVRALEVSSCAKCAFMENARGKRMARTRGLLERPYVHSMLAIAAVCVCVCLFFRGCPQIGSVAPFKWENLDFGPK